MQWWKICLRRGQHAVEWESLTLRPESLKLWTMTCPVIMKATRTSTISRRSKCSIETPPTKKHWWIRHLCPWSITKVKKVSMLKRSHPSTLSPSQSSQSMVSDIGTRTSAAQLLLSSLKKSNSRYVKAVALSGRVTWATAKTVWFPSMRSQ